MKPKHLILHLVLFAFLSVSCSKQGELQPGEEGFDQHPTWTSGSDNFWDKQPGGGITLIIDTAWDGDTIFVNF